MTRYALVFSLAALFMVAAARADDFTGLLQEAEAKYQAGEYGEALELYARAFETGDPTYLDYYDAGCTAALAGDADAAFAYLRKSAGAGLLDSDWLSGDSDLASLTADARWKALLATIDENARAVIAALPEAHGEGAVIDLAEPREMSQTSVEQALWNRRSIRAYLADPLTLDEVSQLLWAAYGLTHPVDGAPAFLRGGLRTAPSAGARYPLEVYLVARSVEHLPPGVYWYNSETHTLIIIHDEDRWEDLSAAAFFQPHFETAAAAIVYSAVFERNTEVYGERGRERYVYMDLGHSAENVYLQAQALRVGTCAIGAFGDLALRRVIGMTRAEEPLYIMPLGKVE